MDDLEEVEQILERCGFVQGYIDYNGELKHASRLEIIKARMNYGEVVPYTYVFDDHSMRLDINLSLDYKPLENGKVIDNMLKNRTCFSVDDYTQSPTLNIMDFIIHLCCHLYKEATTYNWVERNRDLSLYKFVDIYKCLLKYMNEKNGNNLLETIRKYHVEKECYYTLKNTIEIFPALMNIKGVKELLVNIKPENLDFMNRVIYPERKIMYEYTIGFSERLLKNDKILYLKKIENE